MLALGLNVMVGYAGLLDLVYVAFFAVGAAMVAGLVIGTPTLRLRSDYLAIVTLGFGEIVRFSARNLEIAGSASGISGIQQPWLFG